MTFLILKIDTNEEGEREEKIRFSLFDRTDSFVSHFHVQSHDCAIISHLVADVFVCDVNPKIE